MNRMSGFMMWQAAYAEIYFTKTLWPDFTKQELIKALKDPKWQEEQRKIGMEYTKKFDWDFVTESWNLSFREEVKNEQAELPRT